MLSLYKEAEYRMPAEWEKQKSTWVAWPHNKNERVLAMLERYHRSI